MKFRQGDILIRKSKDGDVIWIRQDFLMLVCSTPEKYCRKSRDRYKSSVQPCHRHHNILPDTAKGWRWAKINNEFYYDLKRIPNRKPTYYRDMFGDADELVRKYETAMKESRGRMMESEFKSFVKHNYKNYLHCYTEGCNGTQQIALAKACAVLEFAVLQIMDNDAKGSWMYKQVCEQIERHDMMYLPRNYRILKNKVDAILKEHKAIAKVIKLPRSGNVNALKYNDPQMVSWVIQMRAMPQNFANDYIIRKVRDLCELMGKPKPSRRWFGQNIFELPKTKFLTASMRFGKGSSKAFKYEGYIPMEGALFAGDCWQVDATRVNIIEHEKDDKSMGFLFVIAVRDVHSGDILGYSFDYSENRWAVNNALKMAVETAGYLPYEIVTDRFPGHNTPEMKDMIFRLESMGVKFTMTHLPTGKSHVERCFGTMQSVIMQDSRYYYGEGIKSSRKSAHRSPDYLKQVRKEARSEKFGLSDAYAEATDIVEAYRDTKLSYYSRKHDKVHKNPKDLHRESDKPNVRTINTAETQMLFGLKKDISIKHDGMIITEVQRAEYIYQVQDYEVYSSEERIVMAYDLDNMDVAYLYRPVDQLLVYLCDAKIYDRPNPYGPQAEYGKIAKQKKRLKEIRERKAAELEQATAGAGEVELLMGRFTNKVDAVNAETAKILEGLGKPQSMKKAVGYENTGGIPPDEEHENEDIDINQLTINKY